MGLVKTLFMLMAEREEYAKESLTLRIFGENTESFRWIEKLAPNKDFLDMKLVVYAEFPSDDGKVFSFLVKHSTLDKWGMTFDDVYRQAFDNLMGDTPVIDKMPDALLRLGYQVDPCEELRHLYVLTNKRKNFGAVNMIRNDILDKMARDYSADILVLPSSVHEVLLLPFTDGVDLERATAIVQEVNEKYVPLVDVLSDHAYLYSPERGGWVNLE